MRARSANGGPCSPDFVLRPGRWRPLFLLRVPLRVRGRGRRSVLAAVAEIVQVSELLGRVLDRARRAEARRELLGGTDARAQLALELAAELRALARQVVLLVRVRREVEQPPLVAR